MSIQIIDKTNNYLPSKFILMTITLQGNIYILKITMNNPTHFIKGDWLVYLMDTLRVLDNNVEIFLVWR